MISKNRYETRTKKCLKNTPKKLLEKMNSAFFKLKKKFTKFF